MRRVEEARKHGFVHIVFDDNYRHGGDTFSLKTSCDLLLNRINKSIVQFRDFKKAQPLKASDMDRIKLVFEDFIETYFEFPRLFGSNDTKRLPDHNYLSNVPVDDVNKFLSTYGLKKFPPYKGVRGFAHIVYVKLKI